MLTMPQVIYRWVFSFGIEPSTSLLCYMLVSVTVFAFRVPMSTNGDSTVGICTTGTLEYTLARHNILPGDGPWPMPGVHWVAAPCLHGWHWLVSGTGSGTVFTWLAMLFNLYERCRAKAMSAFRFNVQNQPVVKSCGTSLAKKPHLDTGTESHQGGRNSAGVYLPVSVTTGRRVARGG